MIKLFFACVAIAGFGFEKLPTEYLVQYGNPGADVQVVEYFSLSCPKCIAFFRKDFNAIKERYIDAGIAHWAFHPDPADLFTLQTMVCLSRLSEAKKQVLLEVVMQHAEKIDVKQHGHLLLQAAMKAFEDPVDELENISFLEKTKAFEDAFHFLTQKDVVTVIPALEIDGVLVEQYPSMSFINSCLQHKEQT